ncbi:AAA family ATPase [Priestia megaterium]|uniref:AAA family ATPase n=1 Tax=Priestia megaterium TaxID=1404 RepID=UPI00204056C2|nr:AAA family ATPase [Priestia megaterium]MCM3195824.1 AAA family ATPase [Priestia megaterium]
MIYIKRMAEPETGEILSLEKRRLKEYIKHMLEISQSDSMGEHFTSRFHYTDIMEIDSIWYQNLIEQFHNKCAYCEQSFENTYYRSISYFRPVHGIKEENNDIYNFHYIWLCYEWSNLYLTCAQCDSYKRSHFPVKSERISFNQSVRYEQPLLIDPCNDHPENHIYIDKFGKMIPKTEKGDHTLHILQLNRDKLIKERYMEIETLHNSLRIFLEHYQKQMNITNETCFLFRSVGYLFRPNQPYLAAKKFYLADWIQKLDINQFRNLLNDKNIKKTLNNIYGQFSTIKEFMDILRPFINSESDVRSSHLDYRRQQIEYIEISNIRGIYFKHNFHTDEKNSAWLMLLGENGTGKTTILQAIALALANDWTGIKIKPKSFVPTNEEGFIRVKITDYEYPIEVLFRNGNVEHFYNSHPVSAISYGSVRLISKSGRKETRTNNMRNLFISNRSDYFIEHPKLLLKDKHLGRAVASAILDVLPFDKDETVDLVVEKKSVYLNKGDKKVPLDELSSGYQNVIAITADIMRTIYESTHEIGHLAEGVVLIDEIDAHLHPTWKMRIVSSLRKAFPHMQFIVTSHDPLCLRGIRHNEIAVTRENKGRIEIQNDLPDPSGLRIDQILTSELFGMNSTLDIRRDELITKYHSLLTSPLDVNQDELSKVEDQLDEINYLGATNRERILYKIIDKYIANRKIKNQPYYKIDDKLEKHLIELWKSYEEEGE